jgi:hypothetical protein
MALKTSIALRKVPKGRSFHIHMLWISRGQFPEIRNIPYEKSIMLTGGEIPDSSAMKFIQTLSNRELYPWSLWYPGHLDLRNFIYF